MSWSSAAAPWLSASSAVSGLRVAPLGARLAGRHLAPSTGCRPIRTAGQAGYASVKADDAMTSVEVQAKRKAAKRWVNTVNASGELEATWGYILVSETDIDDAKHSWPALKRIGT